MKIFSQNDKYKLYQGNMLDMLEVIEPNSIDSIITDPPYGLTSITKRFGKENSAECKYGKDGSFARLSRGFMGKEWDGSGIEYNIETWQKCYEVLKPGGYLLAFGGSRTFHRIACSIEDAGFEIRDTIMWLYGSGFPKSMDISKSLDKRNGRNPNIDFKNYLNEKRKEKGYSLADINKLMEVATNGGGFASSIMGEKDNIILPTKENYNKLKTILELDNRYDELIEIEEAEREIIGQKKSNATDAHKWLGEMYEKHESNLIDITIPSTDLAKQWQGWGTALKPSFEPIIVARKPFKGSLVDNVIEYGVGGINIDECRVGMSEDDKQQYYDKRKSFENTNKKMNIYGGNSFNSSSTTFYDTNTLTENTLNNGRFPANTILTYDETDFDEVCGGFPDTKSTPRTPTIGGTGGIGQATDFQRGSETSPYNDSGSASRYFYCAKASKKDRDEGLDDFEEKRKAGYGYDLGYQNVGEGMFKDRTTLKKNTHPTVKPTELMQYLVRLVTPNGGTILDPFNGSGSTGKAVMYENRENHKEYKYIGIELTEEYLPISKARIEYVCGLNEEELKDKQLTIFDMKE